jgi:hypothetical protein
MASAVRSLRTKSIESREQSHPGFVYNTSDGLVGLFSSSSRLADTREPLRCDTNHFLTAGFGVAFPPCMSR